MSSHRINHANIKEWAANYQGEPFDAILCDPPYELGFMGKSWDSSGIAFDKDMWTDLLRILKPGGHLLAFSGSRTYHRMACAIEDAGFEIRDMIEWVYGSGFPKSLNIGKAVDKIQGNEREEIGTYAENAIDGAKRTKNPDIRQVNYGASDVWNKQQTKGTTPYEGYGTALKPAHEPCVLARKPIEGTVANNVLKHGTGGLNIDGSRVGTTDSYHYDRKGGNTGSVSWSGLNVEVPADSHNLGRFPANFIHDGSDEVVGLFPNDNQRFFYTAKASKSERNAGLEGLPEDIGVGNYMSEAKWINDPRHKDGGYEASPSKPQANHHPTVKPLSLTKYLANLIKPPTGGRLLVPFSGSGSEMIGALQAGWEYVEGVELTEEYIPIAEARIKYWLSLKEVETNQLELV